MRRRAAWLFASLTVVVVAGIVTLSAMGAALYWDRVQNAAQQSTRAELGPLAAEQIPKVFGYDYQTVEGSLTDAYNLLTPDYRREFESRATEQIIPEARERQVVSQANVVGVGVLEAQRDSGSVMVYMNRTVTDKSKESVYDGSRLKVDYQKVGDKWLISYITPI
ncbi:mammalian cell entry protein [Mycobacterium sp. MS1601]|uniref:mammalian cell entry protein n=1 Tax=Mycobacterium sp. MS1601 TaxID=1936029 RepID=UPI000979063F|nr:mammalian cell entry protein [Mycobacterium sp. MS1601]AQA02497.1 mammalian cell entry protein [Mycobacterium sp. MS1601]